MGEREVGSIYHALRALLRERLGESEHRRGQARARTPGWTAPAHIRELFGLWESTAAGGAEWARGLIGRLKAGAYAMAGDPGAPGVPGSWPGLLGGHQLPGPDQAGGVRVGDIVRDIPRQR